LTKGERKVTNIEKSQRKKLSFKGEERYSKGREIKIKHTSRGSKLAHK
jgi:hypothetical protein